MSSTMPRKRSVPIEEAPPPKRHLNAALAADMQSMHISQTYPKFAAATASSSTSTPSHSYTLFGSSHPPTSPFLSTTTTTTTTSSSHSHASTTTPPISFGPDFSVLLPNAPTSPTRSSTTALQLPVVTSPQSSSSSMLLDEDHDDDLLTRLPSSHDDPSLVIEETEDFPTTPSETRVTLYQPPFLPPDPVATSFTSQQQQHHHPQSVQFTTCLPVSSSQQQQQQQQWLFSSPRLSVPSTASTPITTDKAQRLAVVPYSQDTPCETRLDDLVTRPRKVIPMPWTNTTTAEPPAALNPSSMDMEIEQVF